MKGRAAILARVRTSLGVSGREKERKTRMETRLTSAPKGVVPARGQLDANGRTDLFCEQATAVLASVERVTSPGDIPKAVATYLREKNLPAAIAMGEDPKLAAMPWKRQRALAVKTGAADGSEAAGLSMAIGAVAETGTVMLVSGADNPSTLNFVPEHHIVVVQSADIAGDLEGLWPKLRERYGKGGMPRTVNLITGPSRSGDIEQTIILGAHGPRAMHVIVVDP